MVWNVLWLAEFQFNSFGTSAASNGQRELRRATSDFRVSGLECYWAAVEFPSHADFPSFQPAARAINRMAED
jgi:hypothetical protein